MNPTQEQCRIVRQFMEDRITNSPNLRKISAFDLASHCAYSLSLYEVKQDIVLIPLYVVQIAKEVLS